MKTGFTTCLIILLFAVFANAQSSCDIQVSVNKGCNPLPVKFTFTTTNTSAIDTWAWLFGDGSGSSQKDPTNIYTTAGSFTPQVTVTFKNGTKCTVTLSKPIVVFSKPIADFSANNNQPIILCNRGDKVCFKDISRPGVNKAPVVSRLWDFGDATSHSSDQNPCHVFSDSGVFTVTLDVVDSNGCDSSIQKKISVRFTSDLGFTLNPKFNIFIAFDCQKFVDNIIYSNATDTAGKFLTKFIWDFGDGTFDSCDLRTPGCRSKFDSVVHTYSKSGTYVPSLYIENKFGCNNKIKLDTPIVIQPYKLDVKIFPNYPVCYVADTIFSFNVPAHPQAAYYMWDFGDPLERGTGRIPASPHTYKKPGVYNVHVEVKIGKCLFDSMLCKKVKLLGPIADIMPIKGIYRAWDSVPPNGSYLITPSKRYSYFDTSCFGPNYVVYYTYSSQNIPNAAPVYDPCRADTVKTLQKDSLFDCNGKRVPNYIITYKPHIKGYKDSIEQIPTMHIWGKGNPIPSGSIYSNPPFVNRPLYMDDTSLFSVRCHAPQTVQFTNFSIKYRGYDAVDNFPPGYPNKCKNPVYPYASDSLAYLWDFHEGSPTTATKKNPNPRARYSTEKLPVHLFQKDGCYMVILSVTDTATGCTDFDSIPVVLQTPDAGWSPVYSSIKNMTYLKQDSLPSNGPRRGMIISGRPCVNDTQYISLKETLPSCYKRQFAMVLDSAEQVIKCNNLKKWSWIYKNQIENQGYQFFYNDTGWKSVGLVITNNYNCSDTVWYSNYQFIHGTYPAITVSAHGKMYPPDQGLHICIGDTLTMWPLIPNQPAIQTFRYFYAEEGDRGDTIAKFATDTIRHKFIKQLNGKTDTITSTVHNKLWGMDDGALNFNYLTDTNKKVVQLPGHFTITTVIRSRFGCIDTARTQVTVGHYADFTVNNKVLCVNDTAHFEGTAQYFIPFTRFNTGYDPRFFWRNPDSVRSGRKTLIPEQMQWDLDGDGKIDYTGYNPSFIYKKSGSYTVTLYTRDSMGCIQKLTRPDFIKVISSNAFFNVGPPGDTRFCTGTHFFNFIDSSFVTKSFKDSLNQYKILSWTWDFGDGTAIISGDSSKKNASHVYIKNGDFTVTLTVSTSAGGPSKGCSSSFQRVVHILGPTSHFTIIGPRAGCVPFTLKVRDESKKATERVWILGDGTKVDSIKNDSIVYLTYRKPGVFCPQFLVTSTLVDLQGNIIHCADTFPAKCAYKVVVYDTNRQKLSTSDTLLCAGRDTAYFRSVPDTGYTSWTINYGNGDSATAAKPVFKYLYHNKGRYHVFISGKGAHCPTTSSVDEHVIEIKPAFRVDTAQKDTPVFSFINQSIGGVRYTWDFGDGTPKVNTKSYDEISHEFQKAGIVNICLVAYNEKGCSDSVCHEIKIDTFVFIPNVFTPNGDAFNNHYLIPIYGNTYYELDIYNRWGEKVFHSENKNNTWDGMNHNTGMLYPEGGYYAVFRYRFIGGPMRYATQGVTLIRR
jgi:gliding motility-associated-like protein